MKKGDFGVGGSVPEINDPRVSFVKGWFNDTLPGFLSDFKPKSRLIIHNDSDLYSSTLFCLSELNKIILPGTILVFDEFYSALHEFRALNDYLSAYRRSCHPIGLVDDGQGRVAFIFD